MNLNNVAEQFATEVIVASAAQVANGSNVVNGYATADVVEVELNVTAASGTTPTLNVVIETSIDNGATWALVVAFTAATGATSELKAFPVSSWADQIRARWTVGGTTPSFTFSVTAFAKARVR